MPSRGATITVQYRAWDTSANAYKTGDVANHAMKWNKDGTAATPTNSPSEVDATNQPGVYQLVLTATECTCKFGSLAGKSSTANIVLFGPEVAFERLPDIDAGSASGALPTVDANNNLHGLTPGTGTGQINAASGGVPIQSGTGTGQLSVTAGILDVSVYQWRGTLVSPTVVNGRPYMAVTDVDGKILGGGTGVITAAGVWAKDETGAALATASGLSAVGTAVNNLNNLSALANIQGPSGDLEIPASSSIAYPYVLIVKDAEGHLLDLSSSPTITAVNGAGTDRSANLSAVSHPATGQYTFTYSVASNHAQEGIQIKATGTASSDSTSRIAYIGASVVAFDTTATLSAIKTKTDLIGTNSADSPNAVAAQGNVTTLTTRIPGTVQPQTGDSYARLGAPVNATIKDDIAVVKTDTGNLLSNLATLAGKFTGITAFGNWLRAAIRKDSPDPTALSEINAVTNGISGTYVPASMGQQVIATTLGNPTSGAGTLVGDIAAVKTSADNAASSASTAATNASTAATAASNANTAATAAQSAANTAATTAAAVKVVTDKEATELEADPSNPGKYRMTAAALANSPAGGSGGIIRPVTVTPARQVTVEDH